MKAEVVEAPHSYLTGYKPVVFLAGSIEMGAAENWQEQVIEALADESCLILNPRRKDWDSSWVQHKSNPQFNQQVTWELQGLERASVVAMYLSPGTVSPISLLETGLHLGDRLVMCCPPGFARKGNIDITCARYGVPVLESLVEFKAALVTRIQHLNKSY